MPNKRAFFLVSGILIGLFFCIRHGHGVDLPLWYRLEVELGCNGPRIRHRGMVAIGDSADTVGRIVVSFLVIESKTLGPYEIVKTIAFSVILAGTLGEDIADGDRSRRCGRHVGAEIRGIG